MEKNIKNKVVVITGASRGIGYSIADTFLNEGAKHLVILDINEEVGEKAATTLNSKFGAKKVSFFKCDVIIDLDRVFDKILEKFKTIDILINNAGVLHEQCIKKTIAVNTTALIEWTMKFWDCARKDKGGAGGTVINVASLYGFLVDPFLPFYKASKHAVLGFTRTIGHRINYDQTGVRVIAICPGFTKTALVENTQLNTSLEFQNEKFINFMNMSVWMEVGDLAKAVAEMFGKADSGTCWIKFGDEPLTELRVPPEFRSENYIKGEL
ncbi:unnamed protein product [Chilo suppressalis]|uniref:Alcohol dehydrogenase n=1 Tax=Chilo suppressalis TaxID=168631 RepID=A0ABN8AT40_CHISP|nr:unnamed protein product [Chilo suppressalis]